MPDEGRDGPHVEADLAEVDSTDINSTDVNSTEDDDAAGDPACWLARVCPECGRFAEADPPTRCARCGADILPA